MVVKQTESYEYKKPLEHFTCGELVWMVLKMLMRTRKMVMSSVILPGITWWWWMVMVILMVVAWWAVSFYQALPGVEKHFGSIRIAHLRIDEEGNPTNNNKESGGEVVGDNVEWHLPRQDQLRRVCESNSAKLRLFYKCLNSCDWFHTVVL